MSGLMARNRHYILFMVTLVFVVNYLDRHRQLDMLISLRRLERVLELLVDQAVREAPYLRAELQQQLNACSVVLDKFESSRALLCDREALLSDAAKTVGLGELLNG